MKAYFQGLGEPVKAVIKRVPPDPDYGQTTPKEALVALMVPLEGFVSYGRETMRERSEELASSPGDGLRVILRRETDAQRRTFAHRRTRTGPWGTATSSASRRDRRFLAYFAASRR